MIQRKTLTFMNSTILLIIIQLLCTFMAFANEDVKPKNVLILHAQDQFLPANIVMDRTFYSSLKGSKEINATIFSEYLENVRFDSASAQTDIVSLLHKKYESMKLDLIIVTDDVSYDFLMKNRKDLFRDIPIVICGITNGKLDMKSMDKNITGNLKYLDIQGNIKLIMEMQPRIKEIDVVIGTSVQDQAYEKLTREAFAKTKPNVDVNYLIGYSIEETKARIAKLPSDAVIFYVSMYTDGAGRGFNPRDVIPILHEASKVPIYGVSDTYLGYGILGGRLLSFTDLSKDASETAVKILMGMKPSEIPIKVLSNRSYFDWNEIKQFDINEARIPENSVFINRLPTMWEQYKLQIMAWAIFLAFEGGLIIFLLIQLRLKRIAEEKLQELNETLERKILERTEELEMANKELESFSYSVSHDLRSPLRHMVGFVELLNNHMPEKLDEKGSYYLSVISEAATKMSELIDSLLDFSRMGKVEIRHNKVDLNEVFKNSKELLLTDIKGRVVEWNVMNLPIVIGDMNMLQLVFTNLISNALKFTRNKSVAKIEIGRMETAGERNNIVIYIKDNGVGFDMQYEEKLFEIFQRLHSQRDFEGNGVGLASVSRIINRHGGKVWAESVLNEGATFYLTLPRATADQYTNEVIV